MTSRSMDVVGKSYTREEGIELVSGTSLYVDDLRPPGLLYGAVVRAGRPHARIRRVDVGRAARAEGVACVLTAKDMANNAYGFPISDQSVLCEEKIRYEGDPVAAVCAESWERAEQAALLIRVDYDDLLPVTDPEEALLTGSPILHESHPTGNLVRKGTVLRGDVEAGFDAADFIVEERYTTGPQEHVSIETNICMAEMEPTGMLVIHASSQVPFRIRSSIAKVLGLPVSRVRVIIHKTGGAFGGKHDIVLPALAALCAMRTRRPVKFRMTREEEFTASTIRHSFRMDYRTGVTKEGTITAAQIKLLLDGGAYCTTGLGVSGKAALMAPGPYRIENLRVEYSLVYTNNGVAGAVRGFGATQTTFACERHMDLIARRLSLDPLEFRRRNAMRTGDPAHSGEAIASCGFIETMEKAARAVGWESIGGGRKSPSGARRRGRGIACMIYPIGNFGGATPSGAFARVNEDGTLTVLTGCTDVGQGASIVLRQIAAEELGVPYENVHLIHGDTAVTPLDPGSTASRVTFMGGNAVRTAVGKVKAQLLERAAATFEVAPEDLRIEKGEVFVAGAPERRRPLAEVALACHKASGLVLSEGVHFSTDLGVNESNHQGKAFECYVFATQCAEVEVDVETGEYRVLQLSAAHDVGRAINPMNVEGQIEGGSTMGLGLGMMEFIHLKEGRVQNPNLADYLVPTALDGPDRLTPIIVEAEEPAGPFGAKGVAEPAVNPTAPAILNAIHDAVGAHLTALPATPEAVLRAMRARQKAGAGVCDG